MGKKKVSIKYTKDGLQAFAACIYYYSQQMGSGHEERLASIILKKMMQRLASKLVVANIVDNKLSFKEEEILAIHIAISKVEITGLGTYEGSIMLEFMNATSSI